MLRPSALLPIAPDGTFEIPGDHLNFAARYSFAGEDVSLEASNVGAVDGTIDMHLRKVVLKEFSATSSGGGQTATLLLSGDLSNTQPSPEVVVVKPKWNQVSLSAMTTDAENDPVSHSWMIPGVGTWSGDRVDVTLPIGRHAVVLYAEDVHRSVAVDATWVTITTPGS